jgi:hypothetical protein
MDADDCFKFNGIPIVVDDNFSDDFALPGLLISKELLTMTTPKPREFWIDPVDSSCDANGLLDAVTDLNNNHLWDDIRKRMIHVIEYSALEQAYTRIAQLEAALEFYADKGNWLGTGGIKIKISGDTEFIPDKKQPNTLLNLGTTIGGKRARAALKQRTAPNE